MFQDHATEILVTRGQIARINLGVHCEYEMGILKDPKQTGLGYLVWTQDRNPANCPAFVTLQLDWRGEVHRVSYRTVGHSNTSTPANILYKKYRECDSEECVERVMLLAEQIDEWFWGEPVRRACEILRVSKIVKHEGSFPSKLHGLEIEVVNSGTHVWLE
jgi:hypothetical protein